MSVIPDQTMVPGFSLAEPSQYFPGTLSTSSNVVPAHPICFHAIDGYVPVTCLMNEMKAETREKRDTLINSDEV